MDPKAIMFWLYLGVADVIALLGVPLVLGRVAPTPFYGLKGRVRAVATDAVSPAAQQHPPGDEPVGGVPRCRVVARLSGANAHSRIGGSLNGGPRRPVLSVEE